MMIHGDLGSLTQQQRLIVQIKPYWRMNWFASLLGWRGLRLSWLAFTEADAARWPSVPESRVLIYYETTDYKFRFQINELPSDHSRHHTATVVPFRYGLAQLGWHPFELFDDDANLAAEAGRLRPFLDRRQFRDPARRATFKRVHPELILANIMEGSSATRVSRS